MSSLKPWPEVSRDNYLCWKHLIYKQDNNEDEDNKVCYKCKETNLLGTKCDKCEDGYISSNGYCINDNLCDKKDGNKCIQCKQNYKEGESIKSYCLNSQYGCMESLEGCLICNDFYNPNNCSQCFKGFYLDEDYKIETKGNVTLIKNNIIR